MATKPPGLFVTGTDTCVGKTYVTCRIAESLAGSGWRVGVYKPAESGITEAAPSDSELLWKAARCPGDASRVCPQQFKAAVAPHVASRLEGRELDASLLRTGIEYWRETSDIVLVEGAGGLMSPLGGDEYVADLAFDLDLPLLVVARNSLGVINQTLQTLITAATFRDGLQVAGVVLNDVCGGGEDADLSVNSNRQELEVRCVSPIVAELRHASTAFDVNVDWFALAKEAASHRR